MTRVRQILGVSSFAARLVEADEIVQNMTVIGRRSTVAGDDAGAGARRLCNGFAPGPKSGDRPQQTLAGIACPNGTPIFSKVGFGTRPRIARVDLMLAEHGFVLSEVDRVQPLGDVHRRSPHTVLL